nr:DExH-box ATP-dependent RNA helicase DExH11 [Ipomoea batatas]
MPLLWLGHSSELQAEVKEEFSVKLESLEIDTEANKLEVACEVTVTEKSVLDEILAAASGGSALRLDGERNEASAITQLQQALQQYVPLLLGLARKLKSMDLMKWGNSSGKTLEDGKEVCAYSN